ncbi:hypothetical protein [Nocardioides sp. Soil777]|uniref:hypothetical protein n=1 Tax=Nocardioides sp. Soil777 TaxID=1736409 RepID=UPI0012F798D6|nr:hypothetical protein [Nocardioides sp. Soil777]
MLTSTTILEMLGRSLRHPGWAYVNTWHHPPLLGLRQPPHQDVVRRDARATGEDGRRA